MSLSALLFDFNGVIVNDEALHRELTLEILMEVFSIELNRAEYRKWCLGRPDAEAFRSVLAVRGRAAGERVVEPLVRRKAELYRERATGQMLVPGVAEVIARAAKLDLKLAVVSGALRSEIELVLGANGLERFFTAVVAAGDVEVGKPDPAGYRLGLERLGVEPGEALAIEDSFAGIQAARAAGMRVLGLPTALPLHMLMRRAQWVVDRFEQLDIPAVAAVYSQSQSLRQAHGGA